MLSFEKKMFFVLNWSVFFRTKASDKSRLRKVGQHFLIFVKKQLEQIKKCTSWKNSIFVVFELVAKAVTYFRSLEQDIHSVYLCLIFEMSIWEFIANSKKNGFRIWFWFWFFFEFKLDFYCLCSLQKSSSNSTKNWVCFETNFFSSL